MNKLRTLLVLGALAFSFTVSAQVPQLVNYQGRVAVGTMNFDGGGTFKFALVNAAGTTTFWSNDGTSAAGSQPTAAVTLNVTNGLYSVLLGDTSLTNMTAIPAGVWANPDVRLRVWFNDGTNGSQLLTPDQRLAPNGYLPDGAVGPAALAGGAVTSTKLASGAVGSTQLAAGAVQTGNLAAGAVGNAQLANSAVTVTAGSGLGGGGAVSLGGNVTLNNSGVLSLTGGGGITVNASTGAITLGSNATSANTGGTIVLRDGSGNFSAGTITAAGNLSLSPTNSAGTVGVITQNGSPLIHSFGSNNFFVGPGAGNFTMSGAGNTASGNQALQTLTTGSQNTALGNGALQHITTGNSNTAIGSGAGSSLTLSDGGNICLDNAGIAGDSNTIRIGTFQTKTFVKGIRGVTTGVANGVTVLIDSNGQLGTVSSSRRYKEDIQDMGDSSARLQALRPVTFRYRQPYANGEKPVQFGLIAEEVAAIFPELAVFNAEGQPETVK